jgi:hypothetical protein
MRALCCIHCGEWTHLVALAVPPDHEVLVDSAWERSAQGAWLFYVEDLSESVQATVRELAPWYRLAPSEARGAAYWMNHCEHCGAPQEDHELHCEPGGAFMPARRRRLQTAPLPTSHDRAARRAEAIRGDRRRLRSSSRRSERPWPSIFCI